MVERLYMQFQEPEHWTRAKRAFSPSFFTIGGSINSKRAAYKHTIVLYQLKKSQVDSFKIKLVNACGRLRDVACWAVGDSTWKTRYSVGNQFYKRKWRCKSMINVAFN